jgi:5-methylcytosine-specific restriction endonuclease McrBC GTP-binding regulatory subunit McrB
MASSTDNISPAILAASADGAVAIDGSGTIRLTLPDGHRRVPEVRASATKLHGELIVAVPHDVTEWKQSERVLDAALRRQNAALAITAHELHSRLAVLASRYAFLQHLG